MNNVLEMQKALNEKFVQTETRSDGLYLNGMKINSWSWYKKEKMISFQFNTYGLTERDLNYYDLKELKNFKPDFNAGLTEKYLKRAIEKATSDAFIMSEIYRRAKEEKDKLEEEQQKYIKELERLGFTITRTGDYDFIVEIPNVVEIRCGSSFGIIEIRLSYNINNNMIALAKYFLPFKNMPTKD